MIVFKIFLPVLLGSGFVELFILQYLLNMSFKCQVGNCINRSGVHE